MRIPKGYLVAIEGIDAVGKNTHSLLLSKWLRTRAVKTTILSFPDYRTPIGRQIKSFLSGGKGYPVELQHMLFAANRWEKYQEIRSRLGAGEIVIVDRYTGSNLAYGKANGLKVEWLANLEKGMPEADITILLDAPPKKLGSRRPGGKDAYERSPTLQSKAQKAYRELARDRGWRLVNAEGSVAKVQTAVLYDLKEGLETDRGVSL